MTGRPPLSLLHFDGASLDELGSADDLEPVGRVDRGDDDLRHVALPAAEALVQVRSNAVPAVLRISPVPAHARLRVLGFLPRRDGVAKLARVGVILQLVGYLPRLEGRLAALIGGLVGDLDVGLAFVVLLALSCYHLQLLGWRLLLLVGQHRRLLLGSDLIIHAKRVQVGCFK